jgi:hypothetical protein
MATSEKFDAHGLKTSVGMSVSLFSLPTKWSDQSCLFVFLSISALKSLTSFSGKHECAIAGANGRIKTMSSVSPSS